MHVNYFLQNSHAKLRKLSVCAQFFFNANIEKVLFCVCHIHTHMISQTLCIVCPSEM